MHSARRLASNCALAACLIAGCKQVDIQNTTALPPPRFVPETVGLDTVSVRVPVDDPEVNGELWNEISEQHLSPELRRRLNGDGIRVGVVGAKLPLSLERILQMEERAPERTDRERVVNLERQPLVQQQLLKLSPNSPGRVYTSGQQIKHDTLNVFRSANGRTSGQTYFDAACVLTITTMQLVDGYVKVRITPEIEQGESVAHRVPRGPAFVMEMRPRTEPFEDLRIEVTLAPGEMLALTSWPGHEGRLGAHFFQEKVGSDTYQKLLLIRVAETKGDSLFDAE